MDTAERLTAAHLERGDYLAASHVHRYAIAAQLCSGLRVNDVGCGIGYGAAALAEQGATVTGVDIDAGTIAAAQREYPGATFVCEDALTHLRRLGAGDVDAVVMFESLEHVPEVEPVLDELARLAADGVRLVLSVPNSRAFHEDNPFHLHDFGIVEARAAFRRFAGAEWLFQHLAEGSLVIAADPVDGEPLAARLDAVDQAEPEYANTFIVAVGFEPGAAARASAELKLVATAAFNRYMLELERSVRTLWDENRQLGREVYGKHDAAAAVAEHYFATKMQAMQEEIHALEDRAWILQQERDAAVAEAGQLRHWANAGRYHAVDRVAGAIGRVPLLPQLLRAARRVYRLVRRRR